MASSEARAARGHLDAIEAIAQALTSLDRVDYCAGGCEEERDEDPHGGRWSGCKGVIPPELAQDLERSERALRDALATATALYTAAMRHVDEERAG